MVQSNQSFSNKSERNMLSVSGKTVNGKPRKPANGNSHRKHEKVRCSGYLGYGWFARKNAEIVLANHQIQERKRIRRLGLQPFTASKSCVDFELKLNTNSPCSLANVGPILRNFNWPDPQQRFIGITFQRRSQCEWTLSD